ncbi:hypothetical protein EIP91_004950 [Steccherinum ochraceum]|uniref:Senescence domain-containing protein n=1 Tax=Steccherinum ochraceum TaxID=92696 RepID=A0A4R0RG99_9APHY|nr:hypothetical protein EIP91_004950 [Steccherinum ochraceum]
MSSQPAAVTIPGVTAIHVVGKSEVELGSGDLTLIALSPPPHKGSTSPTSDDGTNPVLALAIGKAAFPLFKSTDFGTLAGDERVYLFSPQVGEKVGYVKVTLPEGVKEEGSEFASLQEQFEKILIDYGLLKDGIAAAGDEIGRGVKESAGSAATKIRGGTAVYLAENPPTQHPATFTQGTHNVTASSESAANSLFSMASKAAGAVGNAASSAGAWVASNTVPTTHENTETLHHAGDAYNASTGGIGSGVSTLKDSVAEATGQIVENEWGREARDVGGNLAGSAGSLSGAAGQTAAIVSGATIVKGGVKGAVETVEMEDLQQKEEDVKRASDEEPPRQVSGQWQDVPM